MQHAAANAFLRGLTIGSLVAGSVAAVGAILAGVFLPAQPSAVPDESAGVALAGPTAAVTRIQTQVGGSK